LSELLVASMGVEVKSPEPEAVLQFENFCFAVMADLAMNLLPRNLRDQRCTQPAGLPME
jgi:hypothetical protein